APRANTAQHPLGPPPPVPPPATPPSGGRRRWPLFAAAGVGLVAIVVVAVLFLQGVSGETGGAGDPVAAVQKLADAVSGEDPAAALGVVDPVEARALSKIVGKVRDEVGKGSDVVRSDGGVAGTEVKIDGLKLEKEDLGHGVAKVRIAAGTLQAKAIAAKLPPGLGIGRDSSAAVGVDDARDRDIDLFLMVRERGGRWYVSASLTALQYLVERNDLPQPDFAALDDADGDAKGPEDGEQLVQQVASIVTGKDVSGAIALVAPDEAGPLRAYRDALESLANRIDGALQVEVASADVEEHSAGDGKVRLELQRAQGGGSVTDGYDSSSSASVTVSGLCLSADGEGAGCANELRERFGIDRGFVIADKQDGRLRLDPIATVASYAERVVDHLGGAGLKRVLGVLPKAGGTITSGTEVTGHLDDAGVAVRQYQADGPQYVAVDSDRYTTMVGPGNRMAPVIDRTSGTTVFRLPAAGTWKVAPASIDFRAGEFRLGLRRLEPGTATGSSRLTAPLPKVGPVALYEIPAPGAAETLDFASEGNASARFTDSTGDGYYSEEFGDGLFGPSLLLTTDVDEPDRDPPSSTASASTYSGDTPEGGKHLLVITGAPGSTVKGTVKTETSSYGY
ncbi:hypothetical protein AB0L40_26965, partial [Patulibacter sp. NPDC049589]